jgi:hypothetical protein
MGRFQILALAMLLGACSNTISPLHYKPITLAQRASAPTITNVIATDQRSEAPKRLATIMGGFGNPLKTLDTAKPVKDEVTDAFTEGLRVRGLLAEAGPARLHIELTIRKFDADMIIGRTARIDLTMSLVDQAGVVVFRDSAIDKESDMKFFETGIFADIGDLRILSETVLSRTIDRMLDNPAFRAVASVGAVAAL